MRSVLRNNWQLNLDVLHLLYEIRKEHKNQIVVCCDVSKSMDLHSEKLLKFLHLLMQQKWRVEAFLFSTKLERVTQAISRKEFIEAVEHVTKQVDHWSGGTRIGHCLGVLKTDFSRLLHTKSTFIMISDGCDLGELDLLEENLAYIRKRVGNLIWVNPLASFADFEPKVKGMKMAIPYIDVLTSFE